MDTTCSLKLPPKSYRRTIEELSVAIPDPALKLEFLKQAIHEYQKISEPDTFDPAIAEIEFQNNLLHKAEEIWPDCKKAAAHFIQTDAQAAAGAKKNWLYRLRHAIGSAIVVLFLLYLSPALTPLVRSLDHGKFISFDSKKNPTTISKIVIRKSISSIQQSGSESSPGSTVTESLNEHNWTDPDLKFFRNPTLSALASQQLDTHKPKNISQKSISSFRPHNHKRELNVTALNIEKQEKNPALTIEQFESPILIALAARPTKANRTHHIFPELSPSIETKGHGTDLVFTLDSIGSEIHRKGMEPFLARFLSPTVLSLSSQEYKNSSPNLDLQNTLRPSTTHAGENNSVAAIDSLKSKNYHEIPEPVLMRFQSPILISLSSQLSEKSNTVHSDQKSRSFAQMHGSKNQMAEVDVGPSNPWTKSRRLQTLFQNPVLSALASQQVLTPRADQDTRRVLLPSSSAEGKHRPVVAVDIEKYSVQSKRIKKYYQNPVLIALASHAATSFKTNPSSRDSGQLSKIEKAPAPVELKPVKPARKPIPVPEYLNIPIWLVEKTSEREFYSNRLQIITSHTISNLPREYYRFPKYSNVSHISGTIANKISGIVYHASESDIYPFMPEMNHSILKYTKQLIKYLKRKKSYHYFIDRFGRVYRLVREDHAAFHAGHSIWADEKEIYLNLNHAFIGICFEGKDFEKVKKQKKGLTKNSEYSVLKPTGISSFNEAQLRSGKELTDWLRVKYRIPQHNCVPHALISVNPRRMLIGYHLDLARGFPFAKFGLSDKYQEPLPSMVEFGFKHDKYFEKIFNGKLWRGIYLSEEILHRKAGYLEISPAAYRRKLQRRFTRFTEWKKTNLEKKDKLALIPAEIANQKNSTGMEKK